MGSAINPGIAGAGNVGAEDRLEYTVIGDGVNIVARLEEFSRGFGNINEANPSGIRNAVLVEVRLPVQLQGKWERVKIYALGGNRKVTVGRSKAMRRAFKGKVWAGMGLLLLCGLAGGGRVPEVQVVESDFHRRPLRDPKRPGYQHLSKDVRVDTGACAYALRYCVSVPPDRQDRVEPVEGYIGMPGPSSENWYHSGFLFLDLNGRDLGTTPLESMRVTETGRRAIVDYVWDAPEARVRVRFLARAGDTKLFTEIAWEPKVALQSVRLRLTCYPSFFTAWHRREGNRTVQTPAHTFHQGETADLDPQQDWWLVYYDTVFDPARGEGRGPCALLFRPEEIAGGQVKVGSYPVHTTLTVRPEVRWVHLLFWDFTGRDNETALAQMRRYAEENRRQLAACDFLNRRVREFDLSAARAEVEELLSAAAGTEKFAEQLGGLHRRLGELLSALRPPSPEKGPSPIRAEEEFLRRLAEREELLWELKFHVLLHD